MAELEKFVCRIYGEKAERLVNDARLSNFWKKIVKSKHIHGSFFAATLPTKFLKKHIKRANYVAMIWRQARFVVMNVE